MTTVDRASAIFARALVALIWRLDHALHGRVGGRVR